MKLQIFMINKFLGWTLIIALINLDSALNEDRNYYPQVLLKKCKHIEKEKLLMMI